LAAAPAYSARRGCAWSWETSTPASPSACLTPRRGLALDDQEEIAGVPAAFVQYARDAPGPGFAGHHHDPGAVTPEVVGRARSVNPGALGCTPEPVAQYAL
jgi:hypothetical protein